MFSKKYLYVTKNLNNINDGEVAKLFARLKTIVFSLMTTQTRNTFRSWPGPARCRHGGQGPITDMTKSGIKLLCSL